MQVTGIDLVPEAVVVLDADRVLTHHNDRAVVVLDLADDAVGRPLGDVVGFVTDRGAPCDDPVPRRGTADRIAEQRLTVVHGDGRRRDVAMAGRWLPDGGVTLTFRTTRARPVARRQGELVAAASHELRTPLATVRGVARDLLAGWERYSAARRQVALETIAADAERVGRLLGDLVTAGRLDAGRTSLALAPVDVGVVVERVVEGARARHPEDGVRLSVAVDDRVPPLRADADRVEQVVTNMVDNALVHAAAGPVEVVVTAHDDDVRVVVRDHGPGVTSALRDRVFQPFERGDATAPGSGLGLHVARGLARAHGGDVTLTDTPGGGATVTLALPTDEGSTAEEQT